MMIPYNFSKQIKQTDLAITTSNSSYLIKNILTHLQISRLRQEETFEDCNMTLTLTRNLLA